MQFTVQGHPHAQRAVWREQPPEFLHQHAFRLADESYDSLVFAREHSVTSKLLQFGFAKTAFRLSVNFRAQGPGTAITISGKAPEDVRREIGDYVAACGGGHDPRVTRFLQARGQA